MRSGGLVLPHRRYSEPEAVMRRYRLRRRADSSGEDRRVDRGSQTDSWRSYPSLATPSPRPLSSAPPSDSQTVSDKTLSTQDSTLSVPSTNRDTSSETDVQAYREVQVAEVPEARKAKRRDEATQASEDAHRSVACQAEPPPDLTRSKDSEPTRTKEESSQVRKKDIIQEMDPVTFQVRMVRAEIACAAANYEEYPVEKPVVPRYSAVPRTNSMLVNTSSLELCSSDSELSLTDSLEDPAERVEDPPLVWTRHDARPVRGEVALQPEPRRLPRARDAFAYFLSLSGEQSLVRQCPAPEWLRERLREREDEVRKAYERKLRQCAHFRRRRRAPRRAERTPCSSGEGAARAGGRNKNGKTVHFDNYGANIITNHNVNPSTSDKCAVRLLNGNNMGLEPKIDNIQRNNTIQNMIHNSNGNNNNNNGSNSSKLVIQSETANKCASDSNLVQISEIIKIEMSDNSKTVITKEKQINVPGDTNVRDVQNETVKNELTNSAKIISRNTDNPRDTTEIVETDVLNSIREVNTSERVKVKKPDIITSENVEKVNKDTDSKNNNREEEKSQEKLKDKNAKCTGECKIIIQQSDNNSKINIDRKIADILINALEENTKAHQMWVKSSTEKSSGSCKTETKIESVSKVCVSKETNKPTNEMEEQKKCSMGVQTDAVVDSKCNQTEFEDKSCITEPYLVSVRSQTSDPDDDCEEFEDDENSPVHEDYEEEFNSNEENEVVDPSGGSESATNGNTVDKACNTVECESISTQTTESILKKEDILNGFKKCKSTKKKDVQFPPQVIKQIITGTGEYKTVDQTSGKNKDRGRYGGKRAKVSRGTNTEEESIIENNKNMINNNVEIMSNRGHPTPFCKNVFPNKGQQKKPQVLELNVPACSCHMCTLQKISPRAETSKTKIPQTKKPAEVPKEERKAGVKTPGRRPVSTKFQMFEVIPEEKPASTEAEAKTEEGRAEEGRAEEGRAEEGRAEEGGERGVGTQTGGERGVGTQTGGERGVGTQTGGERGVGTQTGGERGVGTQTGGERGVGTQTGGERGVGTQTEPGRKSNLVIGRFRSEGGESPLLVRQYKGRASLSQLEGREELLTLSKGWINFYLLKDNLDFSDTNDEPAGSVSRRREAEEQVEEYTLEIQATPEPRGLRPNLRQSGAGSGLPEIASSSPSPTGEERRRQARRAALTQRHRPSRAVEVARSEQSLSSITSSTVVMSESPPPQQHKLPERKSALRRVHRSLHLNNGSSWTVTVAGNSGSGNDPPPDVEMKLTFGKQGKKQEDNSLQYQVARTKRQGRMIEEFSHVTRNEKHAVHCIQDLSLQAHHAKSCIERTRGGTAKDNFSYEEDYINRLSSRRSRYSTEDGSELATDLQVTGLAITPEKKPRVPTQSERDILRPQRYKFTR